jgi:hypothetical protein
MISSCGVINFTCPISRRYNCNVSLRSDSDGTGSDGATFGDTGVPATGVSGIRNRNRRDGRIPAKGMRTDLPVELRAKRVVFNANLMLVFLSIRLAVASLFGKLG